MCFNTRDVTLANERHVREVASVDERAGHLVDHITHVCRMSQGTPWYGSGKSGGKILYSRCGIEHMQAEAACTSNGGPGELLVEAQPGSDVHNIYTSFSVLCSHSDHASLSESCHFSAD